MSWEIRLSKSAVKELQKIPSVFQSKIELKIESLSGNPFRSDNKKLSGRDGYRLRVGDYRILYFLDKKEKVLTILSVKHRKDAYKF